MAWSCPLRRTCGFVAAALTTTSTAALATPPALLSAASRMTHGAQQPFEVALPLTGGSGVECRSIANGLTLVLTFDQPVKAGEAAVAAGVATLAAPRFEGNVMSVAVAGLTDAEAVTVALANVANAAGEALAAQDVGFRVLFGDVNGNGILNSTDFALVRNAVGLGADVSYGNFRCDLNLSGAFNSTDFAFVRNAVGAGATVDGGPTNNTPPTLATIATQTAVTGVAMQPVGFAVGDAETDPARLVVSWSSGDQLTIPNTNVFVSGTGASRAITVTPAAGVTGVVPVDVTLTVSDGLAYSQPMTFTVRVTPPPVSYLATLAPMAGTGSLGSGSAVLTVSGDQTYATIVATTSNMTSVLVDDTVNDGSNAVMYDLPVGRSRGDLQMDGSLKWTFNAAKTADILAALASNSSYYIVETATNPAGELQGTFKPLTGSQTFAPPEAPPTITINPPTPADASRFLQQAAFGGTWAEIAALSDPAASNASTAIDDWLAAQFNTPVPIYPTYAAAAANPPTTQATVPTPGSGQPSPSTQPYSTSSAYWQIYNRVTLPQSPNVYGDSLGSDRLNEAWWRNAVAAPDSLRQRIATAYLEIFVVSEIDGTIDGNIPGLASYYDMLAGDAFVNFRQLLGDVTLHPIMGKYLTMKGNTKTNPNENYAREIMQLFSIGLYMLQPDGTLMLDATGKPIPTYAQPQVTSFAQVYTGWDQNNTGRPVIPQLIAPVAPSTQPTVTNFTSSYNQPMVVNSGNHSTGAKTLLAYPGATVTQIAANTKQTAATAAAELDVALDNIFNHPNVGPFICRQLIQRLVESNPSPAYVYRVASVFNNDGAGVRGNMRAVIAAILTDYEARSVNVQTSAGYGRMREPVLRMANLLHSFNAVSKSGKWTVGKTDNTLAQTMFRSPTVFNFFDPAYAEPGAIQTAGIVSPEFDVIFATTITNAQNIIYTAVYAGYAAATGAPTLSGTGFKGDAGGSDVYLDFSAAGSGLVPLCQAGGAATGTSGTAAVLDRVVTLLAGAPLDPAARGRILTFLNTLSATSPIDRVKAAVHLVATSPQCAAQK